MLSLKKLKLSNISLTKNERLILNDLSFTCAPGSINTLIGSSGAGKTSLLKCLGQLDTTYEGMMTLGSVDLKICTQQEKSGLIGFVFQQYNLFPHMSVLENCTNPLKIVKGFTEREARDLAYTQLERFALEKLADRSPINLSGGQQQRVAIARALCLQPQILCLDEPSAALDPQNTALLTQTLRQLAKDGTTIVLSSQDMTFTKAVTDTILLMDNGTIAETCSATAICESNAIKNFIDFAH